MKLAIVCFGFFLAGCAAYIPGQPLPVQHQARSGVVYPYSPDALPERVSGPSDNGFLPTPNPPQQQQQQVQGVTPFPTAAAPRDVFSSSPSSPPSSPPAAAAPTTPIVGPENPPFTLGSPIISGSGCPAGTASVTALNEDGRWTIVVLFDEYKASTSRGVLRKRTACNIAVPVHVPQGYSMAMFNFDYRGNADIPVGGAGRFNAEYFWAGSQGPMSQKIFTAQDNGNFRLSDSVEANSRIFSTCGKDVILRTSTSIEVIKSVPNSPYETQLAIDSVDVNGRLIYSFGWKRCT